MEHHRANLPTLISFLVADHIPKDRSWRALWLTGEGFFFTLAALVITHNLEVEQGGVFSLFLASASLAHRFSDLLEENRVNIHERGWRGWRANPITAAAILALFAGIFLAYVAGSLTLGQQRSGASFRFALDAARLGQDTILTRRFPSLGSALGHNALVLGFIWILGFLYRSYGALLGLCWNGCVWGFVLSTLVRRAVVEQQVTVGKALLFSAAIVPHLLLESISYVLGALSAILLSTGLVKYAVGDPHLRRIARGTVILLSFAVGLLLAAAFVEEHLPWVLARVH